MVDWLAIAKSLNKPYVSPVSTPTGPGLNVGGVIIQGGTSRQVNGQGYTAPLIVGNNSNSLKTLNPQPEILPGSNQSNNSSLMISSGGGGGSSGPGSASGNQQDYTWIFLILILLFALK